jgi:2',3'-cyclic-nucleotide 2'-phosphodiesterase (5'-nucleotidase family)
VISGHAHRLFPRFPLQGASDYRTPIIRTGAYGEALAVAELRLRQAGGRWHVVHLSRSTVPAAAVPDPALLALATDSLARQRAWLAVPLGVRLLRHPRRGAFNRCTGELGHRAVLRWQALARGSVAAPATLSLLPGLWHLDARALPPAGEPLRRGHLWQWLPYDNRLLLAELYPRQVGLLLQDYADHQRQRRVRYAGVLYPGGMQVALKGGGLPTPLTMDGAPWPSGTARRVWLADYHAFGGAGLAPRALLRPSQWLTLSPMRHRDAVEALLRDRAAPLPPDCATFLARED